MWPVTVYLPLEHERRKYVGDWFRAMIDSAERMGVQAKHVYNMPFPAETVLSWGWIWKGQSPHFHQSRTRIGIDFGYWGPRTRDRAAYPMRLMINAMHPHKFIRLREWPPDRWNALGLTLRDDFDPNGPVVLVGQGRKSVWMYGEKPGEWETRALARIRKAYPGREVLFRAKPGRGHLAAFGTLRQAKGTIQGALKGASLVVCRHSNVALDAILAGVPVACDDGIARAVCSPELPSEPLPERDRLLVLRASAWWQWTTREAREGKVWRFLREMVE